MQQMCVCKGIFQAVPTPTIVASERLLTESWEKPNENNAQWQKQSSLVKS
jgi:hypothetical protein